jgi:hypothetical protein
MEKTCSELKNLIQDLENKSVKTPEENKKLQSYKDEFAKNCREITDPISGSEI